MEAARKKLTLILTVAAVASILVGADGRLSLAAASSANSPAKPPGKWLDENPFDEWRSRLTSTAKPVAPQSTGGPDHFGYTWETVTPAWIDASSGGTQATFPSPDDSTTDPIGIGFSFDFYEHTYAQLYVSTNGLVTFGGASSIASNTAVPQDTTPNNFLAPFWDDLVVSGGAGGKVYYKPGGSAPNRYFVVEWQNVTKFASSATLTFEIVLYENGDLLFQYNTLNGALNEATVGVEDGDGLDGLLYLYNANGLNTGQAIRFYRPANSARAKFLTNYQSEFVINSRAVFSLNIRNTGDLGTDTFDLTAGSTVWTVSFYAAGGGLRLADTNSNGIVDTGPIAQGNTLEVIVILQAPPNTPVGDYVQVNVVAISGMDPTKMASTTIQGALPAPLAQGFADYQAGTKLDMTWAPNKRIFEVDAYYSGSTLAISRLTSGGYLLAWEKNGINVYGNGYTDVEYILLDKYGYSTKPKAKLTDHYNPDPGQSSWQISDLSPALASTPNSQLGIAWVRDNIDLSNSTRKSNVYFSILNSDGDVIVDQMTITSTQWMTSGASGGFSSPRLAATTDNHFVVSWVDEQGHVEGSTYDIVFAVYDGDGHALKDPTYLTSSVPNDIAYNDPAIVGLSGERVLIAYSVYDYQGQSFALAFQVRNSNGGVLQGVTAIGDAHGWIPDAAQLSSGNIVITWTTTDGHIAYVILNGSSYIVEYGPTELVNPDFRPADYASVTFDEESHVIVTWMDASWNSYLYYALLDDDGAVLTPPRYFQKSRTADTIIVTSYAGQGNAPYEGVWLNFVPVIKR